MASDDLTQRLPDEDRTTQPTIITVLERLQAMDERMQKAEERQQKADERLLSMDERQQRADERLQSMDERQQRAEERTEGRFDHLEHHMTSEIASLREEMNKGFRKLETKIQLLNEDILNMRESQRDALHRIIDLEEKAL